MTRESNRRLLAAALTSVSLIASGAVFAASPADMAGQLLAQDYTPAMKHFVVLTMLSLIPLMLIAMTSFTRIVIVLALLRHALGLPQTPPNSVIITLSICLTYFSMMPVVQDIHQGAITPYLENQITAQEAVDRGAAPLRRFMIGQTRESDLAAVLQMSRAPAPNAVEDISFGHLVPAFLFSELRTAFQIGFVIFLPFLLLDLVVAAVLMGLGMIMVPPSTISLPLKLLLFILIDGWILVSQALLSSYWT
ncbi:flagellar type III secretion system pore protein FliP [Arenimonas terrae]|uniref:Flagellar biosynthetic protein FliP n=1 Tax=Arenimonas terrae TaxID=2546226 RepID=A0A5C4RQK2_9GAMM|nr:flagellar type III secretion system pore protein FliP [Arenimonas terrae]TNJ33225.1 flagellar biosynthesis protein FliP [Arenimonas terrae]